MRIRPYSTSDKDAVIDLWCRCELVRTWNDPALDIERKLSVEDDGFFVGEIDGEIVGSIMVGYDGHRGWINYLAVSPSYRRQKLGQLLMNMAEQVLIDRNCPKINLQLRTTNVDVAKFYRAIGYTEDQVISFGKRLVVDE